MNPIDDAKFDEIIKGATPMHGAVPTQGQDWYSRYQQGLKSSQPTEQKQGITDSVIGGAKSFIGGVASGVGGAALTSEDWAARKGLFGQTVQKGMEGKPSLQDQFKKEFGGEEHPMAYGGGQLVGEVGTLAAPVGAIGAGTKAATETLVGATKAAKYAQPISKLAQAGAEGLAFTAGSGLTEGKKPSLSEYGINAGLNMVFPIGGMAIKKIGETMPARIINSLIKPVSKDFAYGKNPGKSIAELGIIGNNFDDLISNIKNAKQKIGSNIGTTIQKSLPQLQSQIDLNTYLKPIDEAISSASKSPRTNSTIISRLNDVKADLVDNVNNGINPHEFKGLIGDLTKWTGTPTDDKVVNKALKQVYGKTSEGMDNVLKNTLSPQEFKDYKTNSEHYGNLISAENAAIHRDKLVERQNLISFGSKNAGLITALATAIGTGGAAIPSILAGLGGVAIDKSMATPAFKTRLASLLTKLAPQEVSTFFEKVPNAKSIFTEKESKNLIDKAIQTYKQTPNKEGGFARNPFAEKDVNITPEQIGKKLSFEDREKIHRILSRDTLGTYIESSDFIDSLGIGKLSDKNQKAFLKEALEYSYKKK